MAIIETKFSIGDTVYLSRINTVIKQRDCPDCMGSKKWKATSPAGVEYDFTCPRCSSRYQSNNDLSLKYSQYVPLSEKMTVGSVRTNSHEEKSPTYMCIETGVGSGSVYAECDLFHTEEEALKDAKNKADIANINTDWITVQFNKTLDLSDYEMTSAERRANQHENQVYWDRLRTFFDKIDYCESADEIKSAINEFRNTPQ